ncbi:MAG: hypothetical protein ACPGVG_08480 [Mycobacterium sp.]
MATIDNRNANKLRVFAVDTFVASVAAMAFGAGMASAGPNDPGMTDVRGDGTVHSRQSAGVSGARHCAVDPGTLNTSSTNSSDMGVPTQHSHEAGPSWVGSDGWQAIGQSRSNPWGGHFNPQNTKTGPHCRTGHSGSAGHF